MSQRDAFIKSSLGSNELSGVFLWRGRLAPKRLCDGLAVSLPRTLRHMEPRSRQTTQSRAKILLPRTTVFCLDGNAQESHADFGEGAQ